MKEDEKKKLVKRNKDAMKKHWEDFKKSDDYLTKPYFPLLISPDLICDITTEGNK